jgi:hypothetical protein
MQILLLLSALLSALTGAFVGPASADVRMDRAEAQIGAPAETAAPSRAAAARPIEACVRVAGREKRPDAVPAVLIRPAPLKDICLIE